MFGSVYNIVVKKKADKIQARQDLNPDFWDTQAAL